MPDYDLGRIRFKKFRADNFTPPAIRFLKIDCYEPPGGSIQPISLDPKYTDYQPQVIRDHLQSAEISLLQEGAGDGTDTVPVKDILEGLMDSFKFQSLAIDLNLVPEVWKRPQKCKVCEISFEVDHKVWQIVAAAREAVTLGGMQFPLGDIIAGFRVCEPYRYRFIRHSTFSERCCPEDPQTDILREQSEWHPREEFEYELGVPWITPYGKLKLEGYWPYQKYEDPERPWGSDR